jgi:hypothetical protein
VFKGRLPETGSISAYKPVSVRREASTLVLVDCGCFFSCCVYPKSSAGLESRWSAGMTLNAKVSACRPQWANLSLLFACHALRVRCGSRGPERSCPNQLVATSLAARLAATMFCRRGS